MESKPSRWQTSPSARLSVLVSSQSRDSPIRKHSPEIPESTPRRVPRAGAVPPLLPKQMTTPSRRMAIAAPVERVMDWAPRAIAPRIMLGSRGRVAMRALKAERIASGLGEAIASVEPRLSEGKSGTGHFFTTPAITSRPSGATIHLPVCGKEAGELAL